MADFKEGIEEEFKLARQMKELYCDEAGTETNPAKAAEIIHHIGHIYRKRSPDKTELIKSIGLFNAAIVRNPSNVSQVESDLCEVCLHILQLAKAKNQNADLVKKAKDVKSLITDFRNEVKTFLHCSIPEIPVNTTKDEFQHLMENKISAIQSINGTIAHQYKHVMAEIAQFCEDVLGKPPCGYAIVGMGSLARKEITPYSDFEHIILLCNDENYELYLEYFRWFSVIFHAIVLNIQETIIPSLNVKSLIGKISEHENTFYYDAVTPRGISFDGMMPHACKFPLGRTACTKTKQFTTELIKPINEMLKYLSSEADLKNGYHLADILTKTCFVFGNEIIFQEFVNGAQRYQDKSSLADIIDNVQIQVKDDLNKFSTRFRLTHLNSQDSINIKQLVYRSSTIFIAALARIHKVTGNSCFEMINEMAKHKRVTKNTAHKLHCAVAIACEIRLRVYMKNKSQFDNAINLKQSDGMKNFLEIVGVPSTINYFQVAYCLQCELAKHLNLTKLHFYSNSQLINCTIVLAFGTNNLESVFKNRQNRFWNSMEFDFDACINELEVEMLGGGKRQRFKKRIIQALPHVFKSETGRISSALSPLSSKHLKIIAKELYLTDTFDESVEFYKQLLNIYQTKTDTINRDKKLAWSYERIGECLLHLRQHEEALKYLTQALEIYQNTTLNAKKDRGIAATLHIIGCCHIESQNCKEALKNLNQALEIYQNTSSNAQKDTSIADTLHDIGDCHTDLKNHDEALKNLIRALQIKQNATSNAEKDRSIAASLHNIGCCHIDLQNYDQALKSLNRALQIDQNATRNAEKDRSIAKTFHHLGRCHINLQNHDQALKNLNQALQIYQNTTLNAEIDTSIPVTLHNIGRCHIDLQNYNEALQNLNQALQIKQKTTLNAEKDTSIAKILHSIGCCQIGLQNYDEALKTLNQALQIFQKTTLNAEKDTSIGVTIHALGCCHIDLQNYDEAIENLNQALEICQNSLCNAENNRSIAATIVDVGRYHIQLQNYDEALKNLNQALHTFQTSTLNAEKDRSIAKTLHHIGRCHINLQNHDEALKSLNEAFQIYQNSTINAEKDTSIAMTLHNMGRYYLDLKNYDHALKNFNRALQIKQITTLSVEKDRSIAKTLHNIGRCHIHLQNCDEALKNLNQALQIFQKTTPNAEMDKSIAATMHDIGRCHIDLQNPDEAVKSLNRALHIYQNTTPLMDDFD